MTQSKWKRIIAGVMAAAALGLLILGALNLPKQQGDQEKALLQSLRIRTLLNATGTQVVESYVDVAKAEARAAVKKAGGGMAALREAVAKAEEDARSKYANASADYAALDIAELSAAVERYAAALEVYAVIAAAAKQAYIDTHVTDFAAVVEEERRQQIEAGGEVPEDIAVQVDMSGFVPTQEMADQYAQADEAFAAVGAALLKIYPVLDEEALTTLKSTIEGVVYQERDTFTVQYDRYMAAGSGAALSDAVGAWMIRYGDDLLYGGLALLLLAAILLFWEKLVNGLGIPRTIIGLFFLLLCFMSLWYDLSLQQLLSNTLVRMGMNSIMVLAMLPGIQCGISLNLGLPIGLVAGLIGGLDYRTGTSWLGWVFVRHCPGMCHCSGSGLALRPSPQPAQR